MTGTEVREKRRRPSSRRSPAPDPPASGTSTASAPPAPRDGDHRLDAFPEAFPANALPVSGSTMVGRQSNRLAAFLRMLSPM